MIAQLAPNQLSSRLDAPTIGAAHRQLELIEPIKKAKRREYPAADGRLVPIDVKNAPWVKFITYTLVEGVGSMQLRGAKTTNMPEIEFLSEEFTNKAVDYDGGYRLTEDEVIAAAKTGMSFQDTKIALAQDSYLQHFNQLLLFGDPVAGLPGLFNHPSWMGSIAPFPLDINTTLKQATSVLNLGGDVINSRTYGSIRPDTICVADRIARLLGSQLTMSDINTSPFLPWFLKTNPSIRYVEPLFELEGIGPNGEDGIFYYKRSPDILQACLVRPLTWKPLYATSPVEWYRMSTYKYAGLKVYRRGAGHLQLIPRR